MGFWMTTPLGIGGSLVGGVVDEPAVEDARRQVPSRRLDHVDPRRDGPHLGLSQLRGASKRRGRRAAQVLQSGVAAALAAMFGLPGMRRSGGATASRSSPVPAVARATRSSCPTATRRRALRVGRSGRAHGGLPAFTLRRDQHRRRAGAADGHAPRRHPLLPAADGSQRSTHGLLVMNHEYTDDGLLHPDGLRPGRAEKVRKAQAAHGVSVIEVELTDGAGRWCGRRATRGASPPTRPAHRAAPPRATR